MDTYAHSPVMRCPLLWTLAHARLLCVVHFCGHLRTFACYVLFTLMNTSARLPIMRCPLLWTLVCDGLVIPIYLMASQCRSRELSVTDIYRIIYSYQICRFGIISTLLICFIGRNSGIMEFYN